MCFNSYQALFSSQWMRDKGTVPDWMDLSLCVCVHVCMSEGGTECEREKRERWRMKRVLFPFSHLGTLTTMFRSLFLLFQMGALIMVPNIKLLQPPHFFSKFTVLFHWSLSFQYSLTFSQFYPDSPLPGSIVLYTLNEMWHQFPSVFYLFLRQDKCQ